MELLKVTCRGYAGYLKNLSATGFGYYDLEIEPDAPCTSIVCESVTLDEMCFERGDLEESGVRCLSLI